MRIKRHVLVVFATASFLLAGAQTALAAGLSRTEASVLKAVNRARADNHLAPLRFDARLERAARAHSTDMARHGYFAHGAFAQRMRTFGARGPVLGENIAAGFTNPTAVIRAWLGSPEHRANLLRPGYDRIGIGYAGNAVITADFGGR